MQNQHLDGPEQVAVGPSINLEESMFLVQFRASTDCEGQAGTIAEDGQLRTVPDIAGWTELMELSLADIQQALTLSRRGDLVRGEVTLLPPVAPLTEVWAAGVTYESSSLARQAESDDRGIYARIYDAERPELFLKSPSWRVVTDGEPIGIRSDSFSTIPEPELALVLNSRLEIVGVTICNDMTSRDLEAENPLYLPQAKVFAGGCAVFPRVRPAWELESLYDLPIECTVHRAGDLVFTGETNTQKMSRSFESLTDYLGSELLFPQGAVLATGTGIVPDPDFRLNVADTVCVRVPGIGTLTNVVGTREQVMAVPGTSQTESDTLGRFANATRGDRK